MLNPYNEVLVRQEDTSKNDRAFFFKIFTLWIVKLKWQLVSISNMRSILLIKLVATSNWQKFKWSWGVVLTTYLKRVNANYSFPFFHGLSACLTSPILWLGNGGIEQHCGLKIRQVSILWPKRVNANYFFFSFHGLHLPACLT